MICVRLALLVIGTILCGKVGAQTSPSVKNGDTIVIGTTYTLNSSVLGDDREINVWLPPSYNKDQDSYSVLYLLDGALDQDFQHIAGLAQLGALSWTFEPLIVVGVQTRERRRELTTSPSDPRYRVAFPESGGADQFRRFLAQEVIPFVDAGFRTKSRKALMGESLAGLFVVDTFLTSPELFDDYVAISPSLWWDDRVEVRRSADLLARHSPADRRLYLAIADEGGTMKDEMDRLLASLKAQPPDRLLWVYSDKSASEHHDTIYHGAALDAPRWLYAVPPYDYGPIPWFMVDGASPPTPETEGRRK